MNLELAVKEKIQERAKQAAQEFKVKFINEQKEKYGKIIKEYEEMLTEHYQLEFKLEFFKAIDKKETDIKQPEDMDKLIQREMVLLKRIKDIENSGTLEAYDAVMEAIETISNE